MGRAIALSEAANRILNEMERRFKEANQAEWGAMVRRRIGGQLTPTTDESLMDRVKGMETAENILHQILFDVRKDFHELDKQVNDKFDEQAEALKGVPFDN